MREKEMLSIKYSDYSSSVKIKQRERKRKTEGKRKREREKRERERQVACEGCISHVDRVPLLLTFSLSALRRATYSRDTADTCRVYVVTRDIPPRGARKKRNSRATCPLARY